MRSKTVTQHPTKQYIIKIYKKRSLNSHIAYNKALKDTLYNVFNLANPIAP